MKILIPIAVGAVIGYLTNWLAIKMLFRPHYEKKIFGMKLPFTPGLIPKEKYRIANSIGETVGEYLLSPDTIIEALSNKKTDDAIKSWILSRIENLKESKQSIDEILKNAFGSNYERSIKQIEEKTNNFILEVIKRDESKRLILKHISQKINNMELEGIYDDLDKRLKDFVLGLPSSYRFQEELDRMIKSKINEFESDERKLSEALPEEILIFINNYIEENKDYIGNSIRNNLKDPIIKEKIKKLISDLVYKNTNKMVMAFIGPDMISEKIYHIIEKYIDNEDANEDIIKALRIMLDGVLSSKISDISLKLSNSVSDEEFKKIINFITEYIISEDNYILIMDIFRDKLRKSESKNKETLIDYITKYMYDILESESFKISIASIVNTTLNDLINKPVGYLLNNVDDESILSMYNSLRKLFDTFAVKELPKMIELFNISKIVEEKILSFDVDFTEKLILDIAHKELKAITWLGALLGGVIGILTPLLQMLY